MDAVTLKKLPLPVGCARALTFLVILPVTLFFTWSAPVRWVSLERSGTMVTATVRTTILSIIPTGSIRVADLREVRTRVEESGWIEVGTDGGRVRYEGNGWLTLIGNENRHEFEVSSASVDSLERRIESFLEPNGRESRLTLIAPVYWKTSLLSIPFCLVILAQVLGLLLWPVKAFQKWGRARRVRSAG
ncbi:MAG: hypothetical protein K8J08_22225 [Thermoanaerobaculia bacterium]|nr:hypothetical protein [Thermoanaerobaculia bacterium]